MKTDLLFLLGLAASVCVASFSGSKLARGPDIPAAAVDPTYVPSANFLEFVSLGYRNVAADVLWFHATSYFGKNFRRGRSYPWLARMCDIITELDPRAEHVYRFGGAILPWEAKQPVEGTKLLAKGAEALPREWRLQYLAGFTHYFFLDDVETAIAFLQRAARLPDAHPIVGQILTRLMRGERSTESAIYFLQDMLRTTRDENVRRSLQEQLREAHFAHATQIIEEAADSYRQRFGRPPDNIDDLLLSGVLKAVPADPFGGSFYWDPAAGEARSTSGHRTVRLYESRIRQQVRQGVIR